MRKTLLVVALILANLAGSLTSAFAQTATAQEDTIRDWQTYHSPIAKFTVEFPDKPVRTWRSLMTLKHAVDYAVAGYAVKRADREWIVLFLKGAPNGFFDNENTIGSYRSRFNEDTLSTWPRGYTTLRKREIVTFQGRWQANHYILTADGGFRSEFYTFIIDDTLYYMEFGHPAATVGSPTLRSDRDRFFNSFSLSGDETPAGTNGM